MSAAPAADDDDAMAEISTDPPRSFALPAPPLAGPSHLPFLVASSSPELFTDEGYDDRVLRRDPRPHGRSSPSPASHTTHSNMSHSIPILAPLKPGEVWSEEQRGEYAFQLLLTVSSSTLASVTNRLLPLLRRDFIAALPHELALQIVAYAPDLTTIARITCVSKKWRAVAQDNAIWRTLYLRKGWYINERLLAQTYPVDVPLQRDDTKKSAKLDEESAFVTAGLCLSPASAAPLEPAREAISSSVYDTTASFAAGLIQGIASTTSKFARAPSFLSQSPLLSAAPKHSSKMDVDGVEAIPNVKTAAHSRSRASTTGSKRKTSPGEEQSRFSWKSLYRDRLQLEDNWRNGRYTAREIMGHGDAIYCLQFDEDKIISGSRDHQIKIFSLKTGLCRFTLSGHGASVLCLQYDDRHLISGSSDASVIIWDLQAILRDAPPMGPENSVAASAFNPSPYIVRRLRGHTDSVLNLRFDDTTIITCSKDKTMRIWDRWTGELRATLSEHRAAVNAVQFVGHSIVSASGDRFVKVWKWDRMSGAKVVRTLAGHIRGIACVQYDENVVVSGSSDSTIRIWDAHTGALINTLGGHADLVRTVQFDSEKIVSGGYDKTIKIWDMRTGALLLDLKASPNLAEMAEVGRMMGGHLNRVFKLQFNEARIVSCSQDQRIIVWDFSEGVDTRFFTRPAAQ